MIAGTLMISSSINTSVTQKTNFFGMMRCIGMSKKQVVHFVRLEALNWCKTAIPIGVVIGILFTWGLCATLRFIVKDEFSNIPLFGVSLIGIVSGILVGIITVLLSASSPSRRASKVSPVSAVSGNSENYKTSKHTLNTNIFKIETSLGIHHATSLKKNLVFMTGSFALSIILFFGFLGLVDFIGYVMPQSSSSPDISISSNDHTNSIDGTLLDTIGNMDGVKQVFGRRSSLDVPAQLEKNNISYDLIDIISFDEFELAALKKDKMLKKGSNISKVYGNSNYVLATWDKDSSLKIGDKILVNDKELEIAGLLKYDPFSTDGLTDGKITLISSGNTFTSLTGITDYSLVMAQTENNITDEEISAIRNIIGENYTFSDTHDQQTAGVYLAFVFCVYGFLTIIALVTVSNIINSISMSVSAKIKQYGAMRAIGMDEHQITKMIVAESCTYAITGTIIGCVIGVLLNRCIYTTLIESHFNYAIWNIPVIPIVVIAVFVLVTVFVASYSPAKRIHKISVTDTINAL
jgi:ABC-type antimicrobial peptide transport system permease subunit